MDNGHLLPLTNIYPNSPQDWLHDKVQTLIVERKLAPFYRGLEDWDEVEDDDEFDKGEIDSTLDSIGTEQSKAWRKDSKLYSKHDRLAEAAMYKKAQECPICFLYYPPLINTSRCCDQPICTECFVQIKRADPTTTNMISEPAACPYCVEPNFGVTYVPPPPEQRTGLGADRKTTSTSRPAVPKMTRSGSSQSSSAVNLDENASAITIAEDEREMGPAASAHARRKSLSHTAAEVVTVDSIQQDWEAKLETVRATAARRAARRVIFRQIGERLIPVGISSGQRELNPNNHFIDEQGRIILTGPVPIIGQSGTTSSTVESGGGASRLLGRSSRRHRGATGGSDTDARMMGMGPDLEELMVMEAMRLSMVDEEERRKKAEKEAKKKSKRKSSTPDPNAPSTSTSTGGRLSFDAIRNSIDSVRHRDHRDSQSGGSGTVTPTRSNGSPSASTPSSATRSASTSVSNPTTSTSASSSTSAANRPQVQFLKMPPMQRNDSSASMMQRNLPPPLVPTRAGEGSSNQPGASSGTAPAGPSDGSLL